MRRRSGFGWSELVEGLLLVLLGIFSFVKPDSMLTGVVVIYGLIAIIMGIEDIVVYVRLARFTGFWPDAVPDFRHFKCHVWNYAAGES